MANRRQEIALTVEEQRKYLEEEHTVVLSTLDRHGWPHLVAMWYALDRDGHVVMTTFGRAQKVVNLRRDPRCTLLVETGRTYPELKGLMIRGRAEIDADTEHVLDVLGLINAKYHGGNSDGMRDAMRAQASKRVVVRIRPERVASWDHGKLGGRY